MAGVALMIQEIIQPISDIFKSAIDIIDELHTTPEEKATAKTKILEAQSIIISKILDAESKISELQSKVVISETTGHSWIQRNWRPILMLTFTFIVAWNYIISPIFSLKAATIPPDMWQLMKIGMGGYIIGRSAEKIVPKIIANKGGSL